MRKVKFDLKSCHEGGVDLVILAGEHSGDQHAAKMLREIKKVCPRIKVAAFGGVALKSAGADLIADMTKFSVVGMFEVFSKLFFFSQLLKQVFEWIKINRPKVVCLVDYPGFNLRLAKMLFDNGLSHKAGGSIKVFYYISPQIWAWKAKRKCKMAAFVDSLATIFPFERQCFAEVPLDVNFVGHPFVEEDYVADIFYNSDGPVLLLPGSRVLSVRALFPIMLRSFREILKQDPARMAVAVYPDETILAELRKCLCKKFPELSHKLTFVPNGERIEASAAIMSSGTMSLKCCLAGIPGAIVYKTHPFTYMLGKFLVQVKFIGIANILLDKCVWREFLQSRLRPKSVAKHILQCLNNEKVQSMFKSASQQLRDVLSTNRDVSAAQWLLSAI